ncbi:MAG: ABC transporter permease [Oscillospiraceae bacterium]|nr:ABC transporter permease [Oscillospiraceae bacterium]
MKIGFYPRLAAGSIRKNKRMFLPYILICTGMVMMFYIIIFLAASDAVSQLSGGSTIKEIFALGSWVIAIFAGIFLFYTNSFLIRRRKKEFGLYNILGMGKGNIGRILFWETLIIAFLSIAVGLLVGILFSKLAELGLVNMIHGDVSFDFSVSVLAIVRTAQVFGIIFVLLLLNSIRQVRFSSAISLLRSENTGEKPPKGNWFMGISGLLILGSAYYIAVTIQDPVVALVMFFVAVVMVIVGTYLIMIAGSVLFCRILQKKKSYYYKPSHFVSVSSMVYRMKRNGAGLASICILATMVLVMMASTASLYFGEEYAIKNRYPRDINLSLFMEDVSDLSDENVAAFQGDILAFLERYSVTPENDYCYRSASIAGHLDGNTVETDVTQLDEFDLSTYSDVYQFRFVPLSDYNEMAGTQEALSDGEALLYSNGKAYREDTISFNHGSTFRIKKCLDSFAVDGEAAAQVISSIYIVVPDLEQAIKGLDTLVDYNGNRMITMEWLYNFDIGIEPEQQTEVYYGIWDIIVGIAGGEDEHIGYSVRYREYERESFYSLYGALFYIGIILSIVFIIAAVLIIYYKQISEGYEDQARFEIMQKVGMTKREIRKSINSQLLTVFFLPLIFAAMHLAFAFPIISKLLLAFNLNNVMLFAVTTVICFIVFAVFYLIVYRITSNAYYNIVSGVREDM